MPPMSQPGMPPRSQPGIPPMSQPGTRPGMPPGPGSAPGGQPQRPGMPQMNQQAPGMPPMNRPGMPPNQMGGPPRPGMPPMGGQQRPGMPPGPGMAPQGGMGGGYPQQQRRLDPDSIPSPIDVMMNDQAIFNEQAFRTDRGAVPPACTTKCVKGCEDGGSCSPRYVRASLYSLPVSSEMAKQSQVQGQVMRVVCN